MKRFSLLALFTLAAVPSLFAADSRPSFDSTYGMLEDRNPFLRERRRPVSADDLRRRRDSDARRPARTAAQSFVLRGVAIEDDTLHAYLEDTRGGGMVRVSPGDPLGDGRVIDIAIDAISYEQTGRTQWVEVGQDLTGSRSAATVNPTATTAASGASTQPQGTTPPPLPPGGGSLEERMKARRAQQRGNK